MASEDKLKTRVIRQPKRRLGAGGAGAGAPSTATTAAIPPKVCYNYLSYIDKYPIVLIILRML